ncbi:hypothetical protein PHMEG_00016198 [Phytophthora megakarya]|uniref:SREBP regulating gene protein n=1 Tax=Phytophthora megakarya TaxID=4795 RepID=A0A225W0Y5_9STRA|nr:hypothetical protein PHMEG_00016198 [Phytophthora megakarya]
MLRGVNRADDETDDAVLAELMREGEDRLASEQRARQGRQARNSRWRLFVTAVLFLSQVLVELGRRGLHCLQRNVPRYVAFMDHWLVQSIRVSVYPKKKMSTLRVLLALSLAFALPYIVLTIGRMRFPAGRGVKVSADELDEVKIRSHIIVDRLDTPAPEHRQMFLREGGDGLKLDETETRCENTVQGVRLLTDSMGYVCTRAQLDKVKPGCCNETDASPPRIKQYTCDRDRVHNGATVTGIRRDFLTHADPNHPVYSDSSEITVFQYCQYRCRTSSASVQHQNSYRSNRSFCYGIHRPLKVLPTVNSDGLHDEWNGASQEGARDHLVPAAQLELDPYFHEYELPD